jgi:hypothetical protein
MDRSQYRVLQEALGIRNSTPTSNPGQEQGANAELDI